MPPRLPDPDAGAAERTGAARYSWLNRVVALSSVAVFAVYAGEAAARPASHYEKGYPQGAAEAVARAAAQTHSSLIFANDVSRKILALLTTMSMRPK